MLVHEFKPMLRNGIPIVTLGECLRTVIGEREAGIGGGVGRTTGCHASVSQAPWKNQNRTAKVGGTYSLHLIPFLLTIHRGLASKFYADGFLVRKTIKHCRSTADVGSRGIHRPIMEKEG